MFFVLVKADSCYFFELYTVQRTLTDLGVVSFIGSMVSKRGLLTTSSPDPDGSGFLPIRYEKSGFGSVHL